MGTPTDPTADAMILVRNNEPTFLAGLEGLTQYTIEGWGVTTLISAGLWECIRNLKQVVIDPGTPAPVEPPAV